jgi:uncharacterized protein DUF6275
MKFSEMEFLPSEISDEVERMASDPDYGVRVTKRPARKGEGYQEKARRLVHDYVLARLEKTDKHVEFFLEDVYVVWFAKTLQNWKCLISTTLPDGMYYEVTYNGEEREAYIDAYKKFDNVCVPDEQ